MKLFRNPWIAGGVAVLAVAVVFYVVLMPRLRRGHGSKAPQPTAAATASKGATSVEAPPPKTVPPPEMAIDRNYAQARFASWIDAPPRDPFLFIGAQPAPTKAPLQISPVALMKLRGIWRQTGGDLAAIDKGLYGEGDTIVAGYKLDHIEGDQVWIQGPEKRERLDFDKRFTAEALPPRGTNFIERFLGPEPKDPLRPKL